MKKKTPQFRNEAEERDFWQSHDSTEYVDWKKAERLTLANLKPSVKTISLRLPVTFTPAAESSCYSTSSLYV
ncbi:MAG: hypothetical protein HY881_28475 [Deltaproteobacteria bacterium]|nr:hypothetical protein [Deltaproteobacteria bacterium]